MAFMRSIKKGYKLSNCVLLGRASIQDNKRHLVMAINSFAECYSKIIDRWFEEGHPIEEDALAPYLEALWTGRNTECSFSEDCQRSFIGVDALGDAYPCGRFIGNPALRSYRLGSFLTDSFEDIWYHPIRLALRKRKEQLAGCQPCRYKSICNGGCLALGILNGGIAHPDGNCADNFQIFSTLEGKLREALTS
jgi:radical SAM protein with 4Fe4S-binding SPASM domain